MGGFFVPEAIYKHSQTLASRESRDGDRKSFPTQEGGREGRKESRVPIKAVMLRWAPMEPLVLPITAALPLLFLHCGDTSVL